MQYLKFLIAVVAIAACGGGKKSGQDGSPSGDRARVDEPNMPKVSESIGSASMLKDGTIVLTLRAEGRAGELGDGQIVYAPDDDNYTKIRAYLGPLEPGQIVPVRPFPPTE